MGEPENQGRWSVEVVAALRGEKTGVGPGQGWREVRGVSSGGRRSRRLPGFQLRAPAAAPSQQPSADHRRSWES